MIPLAQYLSDFRDEEFVPPRAVERHGETPFARGPETAPAVRTLRAMPAREPRPAAAVLQTIAPRAVPLDAMAAERAAHAAERETMRVNAEAQLRSALAEREAELRAELSQQAEARLEALRAELAETSARDLAATRERWTSEQADRLADLMILQMAVFEDTMRATVRSVLRPLALDARQRRALEDLADAVKIIAPEGTEVKIAATGPSDLLAKFRVKLGERAGQVRVKPDESRVDIRVEADATMVETRLSAWGKALEKALS